MKEATATQTNPEQTGEAIAAELTDKAIEKRIAAIGRLIHTRAENRDAIQVEIQGLLNERTMLIEQQIVRLRAQLPPSTGEIIREEVNNE